MLIGKSIHYNKFEYIFYVLIENSNFFNYYIFKSILGFENKNFIYTKKRPMSDNHLFINKIDVIETAISELGIPIEKARTQFIILNTSERKLVFWVAPCDRIS